VLAGRSRSVVGASPVVVGRHATLGGHCNLGRKRVLGCGDFCGEESPKLRGRNYASAGLLQLGPSAPSLALEERFCVDGPKLDGCGDRPGPVRRASHACSDGPLEPLAAVASRLEASAGRASLLLNEKLSTLQRRWDGAAELTELREARESELCDVADAAAAAAYHLQKWAGLFRLAGAAAGVPEKRPARPSQCQTADEALATTRRALPTIAASAPEAQRFFARATKSHGKGVEAYLATLGVSGEDVREFASHLDGLVGRVARLIDALPPRQV